MFLWLLQEVPYLSDGLAMIARGDSRSVLTVRIAGAAVTAFLLALFLGPPAIRWLRRHCGERIDSASEKLNALHAAKNSTPTMGGVFLIGAVLVSSLLWGSLSNPLVLATFVVTVAYTAIGAADDWIKLSTRRRGLTVRQKLVAQIGVAGLFGMWLYSHQAALPQGTELSVPLFGTIAVLGAGFPAWVALVLVSSSNAVNLTDGLDGLAGGCTVVTAAAMGLLCYVAGNAVWTEYLGVPYLPGAGEMAVVMAALSGGMLGFLWFNCYPAQVFMGDAGSLPIGALLGIAAIVSRQEALLILAGGVFVLETLSVIAQVGWFKLTGRRLIACSPLHNHFVLTGHHELKIVVRFWIGSAVCAVIALAFLKVR